MCLMTMIWWSPFGICCQLVQHSWCRTHSTMTASGCKGRCPETALCVGILRGWLQNDPCSKIQPKILIHSAHGQSSVIYAQIQSCMISMSLCVMPLSLSWIWFSPSLQASVLPSPWHHFECPGPKTFEDFEHCLYWKRVLWQVMVGTTGNILMTSPRLPAGGGSDGIMSHQSICCQVKWGRFALPLCWCQSKRTPELSCKSGVSCLGDDTHREFRQVATAMWWMLGACSECWAWQVGIRAGRYMFEARETQGLELFR